MIKMGVLILILGNCLHGPGVLEFLKREKGVWERESMLLMTTTYLSTQLKTDSVTRKEQCE